MNTITNIDEIKELCKDIENPKLVNEEQYRSLMKSDSEIIDFKKRTLKIVEKRGLCSYMNNTKWLELQQRVESLPFPPAYFDKRISDEKFIYNIHNTTDVNFLGDWSPFYMEGMSLFFNIEYIIVLPRYNQYVHNLGKRILLDISKQFEEILTTNNIPFEVNNHNYIIYGYK